MSCRKENKLCFEQMCFHLVATLVVGCVWEEEESKTISPALEKVCRTTCRLMKFQKEKPSCNCFCIFKFSTKIMTVRSKIWKYKNNYNLAFPFGTSLLLDNYVKSNYKGQGWKLKFTFRCGCVYIFKFLIVNYIGDIRMAPDVKKLAEQHQVQGSH